MVLASEKVIHSAKRYGNTAERSVETGGVLSCQGNNRIAALTVILPDCVIIPADSAALVRTANSARRRAELSYSASASAGPRASLTRQQAHQKHPWRGSNPRPLD